MKDNEFAKRLKALGFPLFETEETGEANRTLADVVKAQDIRLWEGFPVILANSIEGGLFDYDETKQHLPASYRGRMESLIAISLALYKTLEIKFSWTGTLFKFLSDTKQKEFKGFLNLFKKDADLDVAGQKISGQRLKTIFKNYYAKVNSRFSELLYSKEEMGLEYALSQIFSPKQRELFLKKFKGERLTKTEKEYFSRAVKKKASALANPELHRLARKLLE